YLRRLIADRRRRPSTDPGEILSALLAAEDAGDRLTELELLHQCIFLLNAGHETTTNLIANAVVSLLEHPAELARLRAEPALLGTAVEEFLRFQSPNQLGNRRGARFPNLRASGRPVRARRARFRVVSSFPVAV